ncbi:gene transfer agent family protein [Pelagibacterium limicola]|uniref:gene transfer agent family protein n=1 Tax=Pelagibacterium limicola TaxID=2791022 RepID=UPI0018AF8EFB|nr:gene transfer agent family protein [Pelagibacterium limicola]
MTRSAEITLDWADGDYVFALRWGELIKLQEATDAGPFVVYERLGNGQWRLGDISHTIRLALIGGGTEPAKALRLVRDYVESRPPLENLMLARGILGVALHGPADEDPGEAVGEATTDASTTSPTENSE